MCNAITKKGTRCSRNGEYEGFCLQHYQMRIREQQLRNYEAYLVRANGLQVQQINIDSREERKMISTPVKTVEFDIVGLDDLKINVDDNQNVHRVNINQRLVDQFKKLEKMYPIKNGINDYYTQLTFFKFFYINEMKKLSLQPPKEFNIKVEKKGFFYNIKKFFTRKQEFVQTSEFKKWEEKYDVLLHQFEKLMNGVCKKQPNSESIKLVTLVISHINAQEHNRFLLTTRFLDEFEDGMGYCYHGRMVRLLNTFSGITEKEDLRSDGEKIQEEMARISKMDEGVRVEEAKKFFTYINISDEEKQVWLDALVE